MASHVPHVAVQRRNCTFDGRTIIKRIIGPQFPLRQSRQVLAMHNSRP